jgi:acyl-CoA thioesterase FadM
MPLSSRHEVTVEWGDCDPAGIVYYPSYFRWCDQASHRLFVAAGVAHNDTRSGQWTEGTPLVAAECSFKRASQPGEKLVVESHVSRFGRSPGQRNPHLGEEGRQCALADGGGDSRGCQETARWLIFLPIVFDIVFDGEVARRAGGVTHQC